MCVRYVYMRVPINPLPPCMTYDDVGARATAEPMGARVQSGTLHGVDSSEVSICMWIYSKRDLIYMSKR